MKKIIFLLTIYLSIPINVFAGTECTPNLKFIHKQAQDKTAFKRFNIIKKDISDGLKVSGNIILIENFCKKYIQADINQTIHDVYNYKLKQHLNDADNINFNSHYKEYKNFSSIILYTEIIKKNQTIKNVDTFNFNNKTGEALNIYSIFDESNILLLKDEVSKKIKKLYDLDIIDLKDDESFYVEDGNIIILFDSENPSFPSDKITLVKIEVDKTNKFIINKNKTLIKNNVTMIPLRSAMEKLNYKLLWNSDEQSIKIYNNNNTIYLSAEENKYIIHDKYRELEVAPQLTEGIIYVPLSFFEIVLSGYYYFDDDGNIVICTFT